MNESHIGAGIPPDGAPSMPTQAPSKKWDWTLLRERWDKGLGWMRSHTEALFNETARLQRELDAARREADTSAKVAGKALTELHDKCSAPEPAAPASNRLSTEAIASLYNQLRPYPSESQVTECLKELLEWRAAGEPNEIERLERRVAELSMPWAQLAKKALTDDGVELDVFVARLWKRMEDQQRELAKLNAARPAPEPETALRIFTEWAAGASCDDEYAVQMVKHIAANAKDALAGNADIAGYPAGIGAGLPPLPDAPLRIGESVRIGPNNRGEYGGVMRITRIMYTLDHGAATVPDDVVVRATSTK